MVAPLGLLEHRQVAAQPVLVGPGGAVDALELRVLLAPPPVGRGGAHQLEGVRGDPTRRGYVRASTQVAPEPLPRLRVEVVVDGQVSTDLSGLLVAGGTLQPDELDLVGLERQLSARLVLSDWASREALSFLDDLLHPLLECHKVLGRERTFGVEVVVEAVLDGRSDAQPSTREEALDRLREDVRGGVPQHRETLGAAHLDRLDHIAALQDVVEVLELAAHPGDDDRTLLGEQLSSRGALVHLSVGPGQAHLDVGHWTLLVVGEGRSVDRSPGPRGGPGRYRLSGPWRRGDTGRRPGSSPTAPRAVLTERGQPVAAGVADPHRLATPVNPEIAAHEVAEDVEPTESAPMPRSRGRRSRRSPTRPPRGCRRSSGRDRSERTSNDVASYTVRASRQDHPRFQPPMPFGHAGHLLVGVLTRRRPSRGRRVLRSTENRHGLRTPYSQIEPSAPPGAAYGFDFGTQKLRPLQDRNGLIRRIFPDSEDLSCALLKGSPPPPPSPVEMNSPRPSPNVSIPALWLV